MKIGFTLLLMFFLGSLIGQDSIVIIGDKKFKVISIFNDLTIYSAPCEVSYDYKFASRFIISYDSMKHIGYLDSYKYVDHFGCQDSIGHSVMEEIRTLLTERKGVHYEIGILFGMEDNSGKFIGSLSLFKKKKFKKFIKKVSQSSKRTISGEVIRVREYDYTKYAKEFILAKTGNKLSLISVPTLPRSSVYF